MDPDRMNSSRENDADSDEGCGAEVRTSNPPGPAGPVKEIDLSNDRLLYPIEVAMLTRRSESSLRRDRSENRGPDYFKVIGRVLYLRSHVRAWLETRRRKSTRE